MRSAASTAYSLGKETAPSPGVGTGLSGVARAAGNAARNRVSGALGIAEAASRGRAAAWNALNRTNAPAPAGADEAAPAWAQSLRAEQGARARRHVALQTLKEGDHGGAAATPDIKERDD